MRKISKFKVGDKVVTPIGVGVVYKEEEFDIYLDEWYIEVVIGKRFGFNRVITFEVNELKQYKTPHQRLLDLGFEKVAKHKYIKRDKGDIGYIIIAFAFNSYHVKCVGKNWAEFNLELAEVLVDYLEELENE